MRGLLVMLIAVLLAIPAFAVQAHVFFNQSVYMMNSYANITVEDPDWNADPGSAEALYVLVNSTTSPSPIQVLLKETGTNTGIFVADKAVYLNNQTTDQGLLMLKVDYGDTVWVYHEDDNNQYTVNSSRITFNATLSSDKTSYVSGDRAEITICDYDREDPSITATAEDPDGAQISFSLSFNSSLNCYVGYINISTSTDDATDTVKLYEAGSINITYAEPLSTSGTPRNATLLLYSVMKGVIYFDDQYKYADPSRKQYYSKGDTATIYVVDYDRNRDRGKVEEFEVNVTSAKTNSSIRVLVKENGTDSGLFIGSFKFSETENSDIADILKVEDADTINASYLDPETWAGSPQVAWNTAKYYTTLQANISLIPEILYPNSTLLIRIFDPDRNVISISPDGIPARYARVWSDSDLVGFNLSFWETGDDTGVFEDSSVKFSNATDPVSHEINVSHNDSIYFTYFDCKNAFCTDNVTQTINATFYYAEDAAIVPNTTIVGSGDTIEITVYDNDTFVPANPVVNIVYGDTNETKGLTPSGDGIYTTYTVPNISEGQIITIYYTDYKDSRGNVRIVTKELKGLSNALLNASDKNGNLILYPNDTLVIIVNDTDRNEDDSKPDSISINITGLLEREYTATETGNNTNIFRLELPMDELASNLSIADNDTFLVEYLDPYNFTREQELHVLSLRYRIAYDASITLNVSYLNSKMRDVEVNLSDPDNQNSTAYLLVSSSLENKTLQLSRSGSIFRGNFSVPGFINAKDEDTIVLRYVDALDSRGDEKAFEESLVRDIVAPQISAESEKTYYGDGEEVVIFVQSSEDVSITADFSQMDSEFNASNVKVEKSGLNYTIRYNLSTSNTKPDGEYQVIITATDAANNSAALNISLHLFRLTANVELVNLGDVLPGQQKSYTIILYNKDSSPKNVSESLENCMNFTGYIMNGSTLVAGPGKFCPNYADTDFQDGEIPAKGSKNVKITVSPPTDATPGSYTVWLNYTDGNGTLPIRVEYRVVGSIGIVKYGSVLNPSSVKKKVNINTGTHNFALEICNYGNRNLTYSISSNGSISLSHPASGEASNCSSVEITFTAPSSAGTYLSTLKIATNSPPNPNFTISVRVEATDALTVRNVASSLLHLNGSVINVSVEYADGSPVPGLEKDDFKISVKGKQEIPFSITNFTQGNTTYELRLSFNATENVTITVNVSDGKGNSGSLSFNSSYAGEYPSRLQVLTAEISAVEGRAEQKEIKVRNAGLVREEFTLLFQGREYACSANPNSTASCFVVAAFQTPGEFMETLIIVARDRNVSAEIRAKVVPNETTIGKMRSDAERWLAELDSLRMRLADMEREGYDVRPVLSDLQSAISTVKAVVQLIDSGEYLKAYGIWKDVPGKISKIKQKMTALKKRRTAEILAVAAGAAIMLVVGIYFAMPSGREFERRLMHRIRTLLLDLKIWLKMRRLRK